MADGSAQALLRRAARYLIRSETRRAELGRRHARWTVRPSAAFAPFAARNRRTQPFSRSFGYDRGTPIDRYYIDNFFRRHGGSAIQGRVLEVQEPKYATAYGQAELISHLDILDVSHDNPRATVVADLASQDQLRAETYDCVICTQTLLFVYDVHAAIQTLYRILVPGGVLFMTLPGISQIVHPEADRFGDFWRFTTMSAQRLLAEAFPPGDVTMQSYGNVLSATAFLYGLAAEEFRQPELDVLDPDYPVTIGVMAVKRAPVGESGAQSAP